VRNARIQCHTGCESPEHRADVIVCTRRPVFRGQPTNLPLPKRSDSPEVQLDQLELPEKLAQNVSHYLDGRPHVNMEASDTLNTSRVDYLTQLWGVQLGRPDIDVSEDFFEAGGSSMQVIEMLTTVSTDLGKEIDYAEFFKEPCIRKLNTLLAD
jgi:Phosphopantetheine attachment site